MGCALVYCLVVDLTISVLVSVGLLFQDVELDVGGKAATGFSRAGVPGCRGSSRWLCEVVALLCRGAGVCRQWRLPLTRPGRCAGSRRVGGPRSR